MDKWEYREVRGYGIIDDLNAAGRQGWEAVGILVDVGKTIVLMKRRLQG